MEKSIARPCVMLPAAMRQRASPNGAKSSAIGSSIGTPRSARNRIRGWRSAPSRFQRVRKSFQQIWKATVVLPVPEASVSSTRRLPAAIACKV